MDSEQIQHRLNLGKSSSMSGYRIPEDPGSILPPAPDQHESQIHSPHPASALGEELSIDDIWKNESGQQERKLLVSIADIQDAKINDKLECKKYLSDLYKQANCLMTLYNQRVQNLLLDDRVMHRHASEISALLIRGLMPPLEEIKSIEKSLTSTKKKSQEESIEQQTASAVKEMEKVETICKDAKIRITKYTRPPKPVKITKVPVEKKLDEQAISLKNAIKQVNPAPFQQRPVTPVPKAESQLPQTANNLESPAKKESGGSEAIKSKQLIAFADELTSTGKTNIHALKQSIDREYQIYTVLQPFLSVARHKCNLLSMRSDKVCVACDNALITLSNYSSNSNLNESLSMQQLLEIDDAIHTLEKFDRKLPGEVWQLLTELKPGASDNRHHLLNLQCRKLLLDGPATVTQKPDLNRFSEVEEYLKLFTESTSESSFEQQFLKVFGELYASSSQLKKALSIANKPQELQALITTFESQCSDEIKQFEKHVQQAANQDNQQYQDVYSAGIKAYEFITGELQEKLHKEAQNFRVTEPNADYKQLAETLFSKFNQYLEAKGFSGSQQTVTPQHGATQLEDKLSESPVNSNPLIIELKKHGQDKQGQPLKALFDEISVHSNFDSFDSNSMEKHNKQILQTVLENGITSEAGEAIIPCWLHFQSLVYRADATEKLLQSGNYISSTSEQLSTALKALEEGSPSKWFNQIFSAPSKEQRTKAYNFVKFITPLCNNSVALPEIKREFLRSASNLLTPVQDDTYLMALCSALHTND